MTEVVLTLNVGSSSLKFAVFAGDTTQTRPEIRGAIAGICEKPAFTAKDTGGHPLDQGLLGTLDPMFDP